MQPKSAQSHHQLALTGKNIFYLHYLHTLNSCFFAFSGYNDGEQILKNKPNTTDRPKRISCMKIADKQISKFMIAHPEFNKESLQPKVTVKGLTEFEKAFFTDTWYKYLRFPTPFKIIASRRTSLTNSNEEDTKDSNKTTENEYYLVKWIDKSSSSQTDGWYTKAEVVEFLEEIKEEKQLFRELFKRKKSKRKTSRKNHKKVN